MKRKSYTIEDFAWTQWDADAIKALAPDIIARKKERYAAVKAIPDAERTFENTVVAVETSNHGIAEKMHYIDALLKVSPDTGVRSAAQEALTEMQKQFIDIEYDEEIYRAFTVVEAKKEILAGEDKKLFSDLLRDYRRMGFALTAGEREKLKANLKRLGELELAFQVNIDAHSDTIEVTLEELAGLSEWYMNGLSRTPEGKYQVSLNTPEYMPFMEQAESGKLRKELADKYMQRGGARNADILKEVLALRYENARLLGYADHAAFVTETRMAKNPKAVWDFLRDLRDKIKPLADKEMAELAEWKKRTTGDAAARIEYYDYSWAIAQLKKERLNIDTEKVREYFPLETVKKGMFSVYEKLFSVVFERMQEIPVWHEDVEVYRAVNTDGALVGYFMLDLYPRANKYGHACMMDLISGYETAYRGAQYATPLAVMIANFSKPTKDNPSLLSVKDVETFFHEFGHVIHGVLTGARYASQAGTSVARDFVEAPSQMLENWMYDKEIIVLLSGHFTDARKKLPEELLNNLVVVKQYMVGCGTARQLVFALLDITLHTGKFEGNPNALYASLMRECLGIAVLEDNLFTSGFGHLMGYDAGYYGYLWSKVYSADMFTRFKKEGLLNPQTGMEYRRKVLEKGSSEEEIDLVRGFLGREPNHEAFLEEIGLGK